MRGRASVVLECVDVGQIDDQVQQKKQAHCHNYHRCVFVIVLHRQVKTKAHAVEDSESDEHFINPHFFEFVFELSQPDLLCQLQNTDLQKYETDG